MEFQPELFSPLDYLSTDELIREVDLLLDVEFDLVGKLREVHLARAALMNTLKDRAIMLKLNK